MGKLKQQTTIWPFMKWKIIVLSALNLKIIIRLNIVYLCKKPLRASSSSRENEGKIPKQKPFSAIT